MHTKLPLYQRWSYCCKCNLSRIVVAKLQCGNKWGGKKGILAKKAQDAVILFQSLKVIYVNFE